MRTLIFVWMSFCAGHLSAAQSYYDYGWELFGFTTPFRTSPISFGSGSNASVSTAIITETVPELAQDGLPNRGLFGKGWPSGAALDPACYIEFTTNPMGDLPLFTQFVSIPLFRESPNAGGRGEHGPRKWSLRWSRDGYAADLGQIDISANNNRSEAVFRVDLWQHEATTQPVTFRLYGYDSPSAEGSGGVVVVSHKLYVYAGVRRPFLDIPPRVMQISQPFSNLPNYLSISFEGSYGKTFGLQKSESLSGWEPAGVADVTMDVDNGASFSIVKEAGKGSMFYRVVGR